MHEKPDARDAPVTPRLLTPQFALVLAATAVFGLSFSAYFLLPKFLAVELAADAGVIGSVNAITLLASVFFMPVIGVQIDRHGRKLFACAGAITFALACVGFLLVDSVGPLLWLLRFLQGASFTLFYVSLSTLATDIAPKDRLGQAIGLFGAVMISTNALGPALAEWGAAAFGWPHVFLVTALTATASGVIALAIREEGQARHSEIAASMLQVVTRTGLRRVLTAAILVGWTFGAVFTFYQPWALQHGMDQVSQFLIAFSLTAMLVRVGLGSLADRLGRLRVAKAALLLYVATPLSLIWIDVLGLFVTGGLLGLAHGVFFPALNALAVEQARDNERGKAMAAYHGAFNVGFAAGSFLFGYVAMATSYPTIFLLSSAICAVALALLQRVPRHPPPA